MTLSVVVGSAGGRTDEYVWADNGWHVRGAEPPLLRPIGRQSGSGKLTIDGTEIPSSLGLVPAYTGALSALRVSVQSQSEELSVAVAVQSATPGSPPGDSSSAQTDPMEPSCQQIDVRTEVSDGGIAQRAQWRAEGSRQLQAQGGVVSVQVVQAEGAARFDFYARGDGSGDAEDYGAAHPTHVFHEMLRHRSQRRHDDSTAEHPLFGRWVADDSPQFRSTIGAMEAQALGSRAQYKELARQTGLRDACAEFMRALGAALERASGLAVAQPLVQTFMAPLQRDIGQLLSTVCLNWDAVVVAHARRLYESSFRHLDERKAEFDAASDQFYGDMAKHLKSKASKEDERRDEQFERGRMAFDAARWAYFLDLWTATHGWSELEMFVALLKWAKSVARARGHVAGALAWYLDGVAAAYEEVRLQKSESTEFQAFVENPFGGVVREHALTPTDEPGGDEYVRVSLENLVLAPVALQAPPPMRQSASTSSVVQSARLSEASSRSSRLTMGLAHAAPPPLEPMRSASGSSLDLARQLASVSLGRPLNIPRPASTQADGAREGVLFARVGEAQATTGRNMRAAASAWRQYWCVVRDGRFQRFAGWREPRMEPQGEPLPLSLATVRVLPADSKQAARRRFCFEIITPASYAVFQAASAAELGAWVDTLRRAIEISLLHAEQPARPSRDARASLDSQASLPLGGSAPALPSARRLSVTGLLPLLLQDDANAHCADCGAPRPEWCSLNLACLLCIECSGVHRSLGTHVTKVRSLTLDVTSFTPVTIALLLAAGNALNRAVFEARALPLPAAQRPDADAPPNARRQFIESKYVRRAFVDRHWRPDGPLAAALAARGGAAQGWDRRAASALLFAAIDAGDIGAAMRAIALGADVNSPLPGAAECEGGRGSLSDSDSASDKDSVNGLRPSRADATPLLAALFGAGAARAQLELAELLTLNGAGVNAQDGSGRSALHWACLANSAAAAKYLLDKGANPLLRSSAGLQPASLIADTHHAVRAIVAPATQLAEERERLDSRWDESTRADGRLLRRGSLGSISKWHDEPRADNPVMSAARRITQTLAGPALAARMSVSTERPSLLELNGGSASDVRRAQRNSANAPTASWLASLGANKRGRRFTNGIRDLGGRRPMPMRGLDGMATIDEVAPVLPTILSARDDESLMEVMVDAPEPAAFSVPSSPAVASAPRLSTSACGSGRPLSAAPSPVISDDPTEQPTLTLSRHSSVRSAKHSLNGLPAYMYSSRGRASSPVKLRSHLDISSAGSSFVDLRASEAQLSPPAFPGKEYANGSRGNSRVSLGLFSFGSEDPADRSGLMAKLIPHASRAADAQKKRDSRILLRRGTTGSNILRPSSSADALSRARIFDDRRPPTGDSQVRSKFRLLPKSSRITLNIFNRNKQGV